MARRYSTESSEDDLPELTVLIDRHVKRVNPLQAPKLNPTSRMPIFALPSRTAAPIPPRRRSGPKQMRKPTVSSSVSDVPIMPGEKHKAKQESVLVQKASIRSSDLGTRPAVRTNASKTRATPHRKARTVANHGTAVDLTSESEEEKSEIEESIWCDSDEDSAYDTAPEDALSRLKNLKPSSKTPDTELSESEGSDSNIFKSRSPQKGLKTYKSPAKRGLDLPNARSDPSSDEENVSKGEIQFPLPKLAQPGSRPAVDRPQTPPASPSKSKLVSPSKKKPRIPTPPHGPSIDAFWNPHAVNDWNDQYSPQKPLVSPKKNKFLPRDDDSDSPTTSPRKSQSPSKRSRAMIEAKRDFESRKHQLCEDFLAELDSRVTEGKLGELAASTGGVKFIWSKTLNSTAGRANWRKETSKKKHVDGTESITYRHHASIELAEKVIDDEERLLNVVAHEFCHLANFMVSGIKDQPHGRQFKIWGAKCTKTFGARGVEVTTKHSYQIDYKYIWSCENEMCGQEFKRHSKSIDPARHTCGACRGKLIQVKPVPRKQGAGKSGAVGGYAGFVKQHFAAIKKEMAGASHKEVMTALGQRYREQKAATEAGVDDVAKALEVVTLD